ncbi:TPA: hypothetical protein U1138_001824 [Streptococcus suis]|nr:hypothetical protein [Streptococcus suis]HEM4903969.1 hypothetical protein [Streptococcus suis]
MKKRSFLIFACGILVTSVALTACSSNQSNSSQTQNANENVQSAEEVKPVGFIELANEDTERIWFEADNIAKDETITGLYVIKNGKATYYHLLTYESHDGISDPDQVAYGPRIKDSLTFSDIKDMSNKEIIEKAKKIDKEAYDSYFQSFLDIVDTAIIDWSNEPSTSENPIYVPVLENIKNPLSSLQGDSNYRIYRKRVTEQKLSAKVETDDTGNSIVNEEIQLPIFVKYEVDFFYSKQLKVGNETRTLVIDASTFNIGDIYDSTYVAFGDSPLITRDMPEKSYPYLDILGTKNVVEE